MSLNPCNWVSFVPKVPLSCAFHKLNTLGNFKIIFAKSYFYKVGNIGEVLAMHGIFLKNKYFLNVTNPASFCLVYPFSQNIDKYSTNIAIK